MGFVFSILIALGLDIAIGWPEAVFRRIGHPVSWIGSLIGRLDQGMNSPADKPVMRRLKGIVALILVFSICVLIAILLSQLVGDTLLGGVLLGALMYPFLAARSLHTHVSSVASPLIAGNIGAARIEVAKIVGRDPAQLDSAAISRATLESLAENTSDGIVAPIFWGAIFGLPGLVGYKVINTADSMIGHKTLRHLHFGWFSARLDDLVNLIPARLSGILVAIVSLKFLQVIRVVWRDAALHRSPNAGWPEAAMAASIGCRLSGPRSYDGVAGDEPWLNGGACDPTPTDILEGLALYRLALVFVGAILFGLAMI